MADADLRPQGSDIESDEDEDMEDDDTGPPQDRESRVSHKHWVIEVACCCVNYMTRLAVVGEMPGNRVFNIGPWKLSLGFITCTGSWDVGQCLCPKFLLPG